MCVCGLGEESGEYEEDDGEAYDDEDDDDDDGNESDEEYEDEDEEQLPVEGIETDPDVCTGTLWQCTG